VQPDHSQLDYLLQDDDVRKLERLSLINASARYELLSANQQLIDFHLNRVMKAKGRKVEAIDEVEDEQSALGSPAKKQQVWDKKQKQRQNVVNTFGLLSNSKEVDERIQ
jgi:hypothetical protein